MARIPEAEIERLKSEVSLVRLMESAGVELKRSGKDWACRCPFHSDDNEPSLIVSVAKNLFHCFACGAAGSPVDWVMKSQGVSFRHAVELLRNDLPLAAAASVQHSSVRQLPAPVTPDADDQQLLNQVIDYYHGCLKQSPEALAYLASRGLDHPDMIDTFKLGFANRTLGLRLPAKTRMAGADIRTRLQRIGIYRESGHEHFNGSLIVPVLNESGDVTEIYGRKLLDNLRAGTPLHLYLPGPHRGVWNSEVLQASKEIILCESLIDALTFWCAGYRNVTTSYGVEGFTDDHFAAFKRYGIERVLIAYDRDDAGDRAAEKLSILLNAEGIETFRILFPHGMDANAFALQVTPVVQSLGLVIRQAEWMGKGHAPPKITTSVAVLPEQDTTSVEFVEKETRPFLAAAATLNEVLNDFPLAAATTKKADIAAPMIAPELTALPASPVPPSAPALPVVITEQELTLTLGNRVYVVRGIEKNLSYEQLKVWIKASCDAQGAAADFVHVDTVELYAAKQRQGWIKQTSIELGLSEELVKADLGKLLRVVEQRQDELIRARLAPRGTAAANAAALTPEQHDSALALLRDPALIERIVADVETIGVVGEASNALVGYLACVSRKLEKPLAVLIQSTSAAGKSTLMEALLSLIPEHERVHYSAMTGQSLFYLGEGDLQHKILAIAEEEGVRQASYALKLLQSQGELTMASTGKDPVTGKLVTEEYHVKGPVMLFLTTTAIEIDEELLNRCLVLTINESREQTEAIHRRQRAARTLAGVLGTKQAQAVRALHQAAQQLLQPLVVVNPYAEQLTFRSESTRMRRDHQKYLTLIETITLLHQYQRERKKGVAGGKSMTYIEVTLDDIALANRLAHEVLGRSLDELPPQTRRLLGAMVGWVEGQCREQRIERRELRFGRADIRRLAGLSETQLRVHIERLVAMDYLLVHRGQRGQSFVYELLFDGHAEAVPQLIGLVDVALLKYAATIRSSLGESVSSRGSEGEFAGSSRPQRGAFAVGSRGEAIPGSVSVDAGAASLAAALTQTARLGAEKNPSSYPKERSYPQANGTLPPALDV